MHTQGIHNLSFAEYLSHAGYGSSDLKTFRQGPPAAVQWRRQHRTETDATRLGSAAHCLILTPDDFDRDYVVKPDGMTFQSNANKALRDEWLASGRSILSSDDHAKLRGVQSAFEGKSAAFKSMRRAGQLDCVERSVFWRCEASGLLCKGRPDWFLDEVYDLKVSVVADRGEDKLAFLAHANGWLHQLAHNRAGLRANGVDVHAGRLVVVSPNEPHNVWLLELSEADCEFLEMENEHTRKRMAVCERSGDWPGTPDEFQRIELPMSATWTETDMEDAVEVMSDV